MIQAIRISLRRLAMLVLSLALAGCATALKEGNQLIEQGRWQEGLARIEQGMKEHPRDPELRIHYFRQRELILGRLLQAAAGESAAGRFEAADDLYRQALSLDAGNARATAGLEAVVTARRHRVLVGDARRMLDKGDTVSADLMVKGVLAENSIHPEALVLDRELRERERRRSLTPPVLKSRMQNTVNLEFRDAPLKLALEAISRSAGINFVFDRDVRTDLKTTIFVKDVRVEDAIDMMLGPNQLEKKILSETTMLVYPNTPQKLRENQELVVRAFQLGNADPKQTINLIRTMVKTKDLFVDERVNMLVMRDTPDAIRIAEKLVGMQDAAEPEVVLELEILEVSRNKVRDLGITYPTQFSGPGGDSATLATIKQLDSRTIGVNSGYAIKLIRNDGDTKTLANPSVRVRNKEKARVHVGDRVPVISSTLVGTGSSAPVSSEQIQYLDVGIKIDAEPTVHPDDTVSVKINLDVSSLGTPTTTKAGTVAYEVGTRNVTTVLRLRDGETQALMGLIREDDSKSRSGLPFIGELPLLDRIFGTVKDDTRSRELVLLITPRIIRGHGHPDATQVEFWSGTEAALRAKSPFAAAVEPTAKTAAKGPAPVAVGAAAASPGAAATASAESAPAATLLAPVGVLNLKWVAPGKAKSGSEFKLTLNAQSESALKGATVNLRYNPLEFELAGVDDGGYFKQGGAPGVFNSRIEPTLGMISVTFGAGDGRSATGDGGLVSLRLKPVTTAASAKVEVVSVVGLDEANRQLSINGANAIDVAIEP